MIKKILKSTSFYDNFTGFANDLTKRWAETHRHFHTLTHLNKILEQIENDKDKFSKEEYDILKIVAIYHDIVYLPREDKYNIKESIDKFESDFYDLPENVSLTIKKIIHSTNYHNFEHEDKLIRMFNSYDMNGILNGDLKTLIEDGDNVAKEFNLDIDFYKENRIQFLEKYKKYNPNIQKCIDYLRK